MWHTLRQATNKSRLRCLQTVGIQLLEEWVSNWHIDCFGRHNTHSKTPQEQLGFIGDLFAFAAQLLQFLHYFCAWHSSCYMCLLPVAADCGSLCFSAVFCFPCSQHIIYNAKGAVRATKMWKQNRSTPCNANLIRHFRFHKIDDWLLLTYGSLQCFQFFCFFQRKISAHLPCHNSLRSKATAH